MIPDSTAVGQLSAPARAELSSSASASHSRNRSCAIGWVLLLPHASLPQGTSELFQVVPSRAQRSTHHGSGKQPVSQAGRKVDGGRRGALDFFGVKPLDGPKSCKLTLFLFLGSCWGSSSKHQPRVDKVAKLKDAF